MKKWIWAIILVSVYLKKLFNRLFIFRWRKCNHNNLRKEKKIFLLQNSLRFLTISVLYWKLKQILIKVTLQIFPLQKIQLSTAPLYIQKFWQMFTPSSHLLTIQVLIAEPSCDWFKVELKVKIRKYWKQANVLGFIYFSF